MQWTLAPRVRQRLGYGLVALALFGGGGVATRGWDVVQHLLVDHDHHHDQEDALAQHEAALQRAVAAINILLERTPAAASAFQQLPQPAPEPSAVEEPDDATDPS